MLQVHAHTGIAIERVVLIESEASHSACRIYGKLIATDPVTQPFDLPAHGTRSLPGRSP